MPNTESYLILDPRLIHMLYPLFNLGTHQWCLCSLDKRCAEYIPLKKLELYFREFWIRNRRQSIWQQ